WVGPSSSSANARLTVFQQLPRAPAMAHTSKSSTLQGPWSLELTRGRELGRVFGLAPGDTVLGNALNGEPGLDLMNQEEDSPRRMSARHAALTSTSQELTIRDLESPGGTFVNRQRLLSGQSRRLQPGDVIQLGSVQLRVKRGTGPTDVSQSDPTRVPPAAK